MEINKKVFEVTLISHKKYRNMGLSAYRVEEYCILEPKEDLDGYLYMIAEEQGKSSYKSSL